MTPEQVAERFTSLLGGSPDGADSSVVTSVAWDQATIDVPVDRWVEAAALAAGDPELAASYFDWLSAVDEGAEFAVVLHLWSVERHHHVLLRTRVPRDAAVVPTLTGVFRGAAWHERETHEMFGIDFDGHPGLVPLLLPEGFEGHPLRKEFVLASRVAKAWPGAKEPGESDDGSPSRRRMLPPGVPEPGTWGPEVGR